MKARRLAVLFVILVACAATPEMARADRPIAVFFVRHAEKQVSESKDPNLTEAGRRRAAALAEMLAQADVTHLFATEYRRTQQTLEPLAQRSGREVQVISAREPQAQIRLLRGLPEGSTAVVAGHSNTIPGLACDLGGAAPGLDCDERQLAEDVYDRLYLVVLPPAASDAIAPRALTLRYGD